MECGQDEAVRSADLNGQLTQEILSVLAVQKVKLQEEHIILQKAEKKYAALQDALGQMDEAKARARAAMEEATGKLTDAAAAANGSQVLLEELCNSRT